MLLANSYMDGLANANATSKFWPHYPTAYHHAVQSSHAFVKYAMATWVVHSTHCPSIYLWPTPPKPTMTTIQHIFDGVNCIFGQSLKVYNYKLSK